VHEFGATIKAKKGLLWIPLSDTGLKIPAREYQGKLKRVDRTRPSGAGFKGQKRHPVTGRFTGGHKRPLLLDIKDKQPKYFGIAQVTIRPKFHIRQICREVMGRFQENFTARNAP
jgi:hypothetical protein